MGDFTKLKIWRKAHELTIRVYTLTRKLPKEEDYVLKPQTRRAAVSVESCIAEGETRFTVAAPQSPNNLKKDLRTQQPKNLIT